MSWKYRSTAVSLILSTLLACSSPEEEQADQATIQTPQVAQGIIEVFDVGEGIYVRSLALEESSKTLWVGTSMGVHEIDIATQEVRNTFTRDDGLANEYVFGIGIDVEGYKWFGTNAGGVSRYKDGDWKTYFPMHGLADYWIYCFANGKDGGLWIGTWAGANHFDPKTGTFTTYFDELVNEWVYGLAVDDAGVVWFGTEGGVSAYDGSTWQEWTHDDGIGAPNADALPFSRNTGLGTRSRHDLGVLADGQATYNPNYVFSLIVAADQTIWAGTWGGGVAHLVDGKWENLTEANGLAGNIVYSVAEDSEGVLWFGTNRGLSRYDGKTWQSYNVHNGLPNNDVYSIAALPDGEVWVGTNGGVVHLGYKDSNQL